MRPHQKKIVVANFVLSLYQWAKLKFLFLQIWPRFAITIERFKSYFSVLIEFALICYNFGNNKIDINRTLFQKNFLKPYK